jgi:uncharacterized protein
MILSIEHLQPFTKLELDLDSQQCDLPADVGRFMAPIHLDAHIKKVEEDITIEGRIFTKIEMMCSRCLKPHETSLGDTFEVIYRPQPDGDKQGEEIELDDTELNVTYYQGDSISVVELLREQLLLLLPMKPLCKVDCAGLCPSCGKDLNEERCTCSRETFDPRLTVLEKLLHKEK